MPTETIDARDLITMAHPNYPNWTVRVAMFNYRKFALAIDIVRCTNNERLDKRLINVSPEHKMVVNVRRYSKNRTLSCWFVDKVAVPDLMDLSKLTYFQDKELADWLNNVVFNNTIIDNPPVKIHQSEPNCDEEIEYLRARLAKFDLDSRLSKVEFMLESHDQNVSSQSQAAIESRLCAIESRLNTLQAQIDSNRKLFERLTQLFTAL